jgi:lysophospholipase L1-like esterase
MINGYKTQANTDFPKLKAILESYNPKFALMMLGTNDAQTEPFTSEADFEQNLKYALALFFKQGTVPILMTPPPYLKAESEWADKDEYKRVEKYTEIILKVAKERKVPVINFRANMLNMAELAGDLETVNGELRKRYFAKNDWVHLKAQNLWWDRETTRHDLSNDGHLLRMWLIVNKLYFVWSQTYKLNGAN